MEHEYTPEVETIEVAEYSKGFNHAVILAEYEPALLSDIIPSINPVNDYFAGFFHGKEQWERDQQKAQVDELKQIRNQSRTNDQELER